MLKKIGGLQFKANWINEWKSRPILLRMLHLNLSRICLTFSKAICFEFVLVGLGFDISIWKWKRSEVAINENNILPNT